MSISQSLACSFYNPADGTVVQFNRIHQDSDFRKLGSDEEDAAGSGVFQGEEAILELVVYADDQAKLDQIRAWQEAETPVRFMALGSSSSIIWDESRPLTIEEPVSMSPLSRSTASIRMMATDVQLPIWTGKNLLHGAVIVRGFDAGWADNDSDGVADGFTADSEHWSFTNGQQVFDGSGVAEIFEITRNFPVSNIDLTLSFNVVALGATENTQTRVFIDDFGATQLSFEQLGDIDATGIRKLQFITPADAYEFKFELLSASGSDVGLIIEDVMLAPGDQPYKAG